MYKLIDPKLARPALKALFRKMYHGDALQELAHALQELQDEECSKLFGAWILGVLEQDAYGLFSLTPSFTDQATEPRYEMRLGLEEDHRLLLVMALARLSSLVRQTKENLSADASEPLSARLDMIGGALEILTIASRPLAMKLIELQQLAESLDGACLNACSTGSFAAVLSKHIRRFTERLSNLEEKDAAVLMLWISLMAKKLSSCWGVEDAGIIHSSITGLIPTGLRQMGLPVAPLEVAHGEGKFADAMSSPGIWLDLQKLLTDSTQDPRLDVSAALTPFLLDIADHAALVPGRIVRKNAYVQLAEKLAKLAEELLQALPNVGVSAITQATERFIEAFNKFDSGLLLLRTQLFQILDKYSYWPELTTEIRLPDQPTSNVIIAGNTTN